MTKNYEVSEKNYTLKSEILNELKRLRKSISKSLRKVEGSWDKQPSPFLLIPSVIHPLTFGNPDRNNVFERRNGYLTFLWEFIETLKVSAMLSLGFRYASALTLLRLGFETLIRAAFFDTVAQEQYRTQESIQNLRVKSFVNGLLAKELESNPSLVKEMEVSSSVLMQALQSYQVDSEKWREMPRLPHMTEALEQWKFFDPIEAGEIYDLYGWLSVPVHGTPPYTDVVAQIAYVENPFGELKFVKELLDNYIFLLNNVLDISLVLTFNILKHEHDSDYIRDVARKLSEEDIESEKLPYYKQLLDAHK
jgi:hypothetical protein